MTSQSASAELMPTALLLCYFLRQETLFYIVSFHPGVGREAVVLVLVASCYRNRVK